MGRSIPQPTAILAECFPATKKRLCSPALLRSPSPSAVCPQVVWNEAVLRKAAETVQAPEGKDWANHANSWHQALNSRGHCCFQRWEMALAGRKSMHSRPGEVSIPLDGSKVVRPGGQGAATRCRRHYQPRLPLDPTTVAARTLQTGRVVAMEIELRTPLALKS